MNSRARSNFLILLVAGVVFLAGLAYWSQNRRDRTEREEPDSSVGPSAAEKEEILAFWGSFGKARELRLAGNWREAIVEYRRALAIDRTHEDSLYGIANCHFELDDFAEALEYLQRLVQVNPMSHRGHLQIGLVHSCPLAGKLFDLDAARAALERAFEINREETGALLRLGEVALVAGSEKRAMECFALANQSNFRAVEGYYLRAFIIWKKNGDTEESRELLLEALRQSRTRPVVAGVPGEGDTKSGSLLPRTTVGGKRLLRAFWAGLEERYPEDRIEAGDLAAEFSAVSSYLEEVRRRL